MQYAKDLPPKALAKIAIDRGYTIDRVNGDVYWYVCDGCNEEIPSAYPPDRVHHDCVHQFRKSEAMRRRLRKPIRFGAALMRHAADGFRSVSREQYQARLEVCDRCRFRGVENECTLCGCGLDGVVLHKAKWRSENCELGKWPWFDEETGERLAWVNGESPTPSTLPDEPRRACLMVMGGPSSRWVDLDAVRDAGLATFSVNGVPRAVGLTDYWTCADPPRKFRGAWWSDPSCRKLVPAQLALSDAYDTDGDTVMRRAVEFPNVFCFWRMADFDPDNYFVDPNPTWGMTDDRRCALGIRGDLSVMLTAIRLAYDVGFRRLYFIGTEFEMSADDPYCHDAGADENKARGNTAKFSRLDMRLASLVGPAAERGLTLTNCTPGGKLTAFHRMHLGDAINAERERAVNHHADA